MDKDGGTQQQKPAGAEAAGAPPAQFVPRVDPLAVTAPRTLAKKTIFITGGTRGIGHAIGLRAAKDGANIVIAATSDKPQPNVEGTIYTAAQDMERAGGAALALKVDVRNEEEVAAAVAAAVAKFGGIDILINNASAIALTPTEATSMKQYDLMNQIGARGAFLCTKLCAPHLARASNPHVLTISPPLSMEPRWFQGHVAYTTAKYGMSMCVLGHSAEFAPKGIAVNALWPRTVIGTEALRNFPNGDAFVKASRKPDVMADAAHFVLTRVASKNSGNFFIDDAVLASEGVTEEQMQRYSVVPGARLVPDFFL